MRRQDYYSNNAPKRNQHNEQRFQGYQQYPPYQYQPNQQQQQAMRQQTPQRHKKHWFLWFLGIIVAVIIGITLLGAHENNEAKQQAQQYANQQGQNKIERELQGIRAKENQGKQWPSNPNPNSPTADEQTLADELRVAQIDNSIQQAIISAYEKQTPAQQVSLYKKIQAPIDKAPHFARPFIARHVANYAVQHYLQK